MEPQSSTNSNLTFIQRLTRSDVNPLNHKSRTLPIFNVVDKYGRAFHLSWIGFFVAFLSWFAFPPLIHGVIKEDLNLTHSQIANSNIIGLLATFLVRLVVGPLCDRYGPRYVMIGCLVLGAIPTAFTPLIRNSTDLVIIRFFVGILGGTFVPCQVWTNQFFDANIIGLSNGLAAGWGNAGGGLTFFVMPGIVTWLMESHGISRYWAWRLAFPLCPLIIILLIALACLLLADDTPTGPWKNRNLLSSSDHSQEATTMNLDDLEKQETDGNNSDPSQIPLTGDHSIPTDATKSTLRSKESRSSTGFVEILKAAVSPQTFLVALPYMCSFGSELAVEGMISDFYVQTAQVADGIVWSSRKAGIWASVFGLLNVFTRPLGGYFSDVLYNKKGVFAKKWWMIFLQVMQGIFFLRIGIERLNISSLLVMMTGLAVFMEAANGAVFSLVPNVNKEHNGVVSGVTGGFGNVGGIVFGLMFRINGANYQRSYWMIGIVCIVANLIVGLIPIHNKSNKIIT